MSDTLTPDRANTSENGSGVQSPPPPTDQQQFDAAVNRDGRIFLQVFGGLAIFAALVMSIIALLVSTGNDSTRTMMAPAAPAVAATPAAPAAPGKIGVTLKEFSVNPTATQAPAGRVRFNVKNGGTIPHEFVVLRTDKPAGALLDGKNGARADETGNVGETGDLAPGAAKTVSITLKAGHYALICNLPGHYSAGQHIDFTVK